MINQTIKGAISDYLENVTSLKSKASQNLELIFFKDFENFFILKNINLVKDIQPVHAEGLQSYISKNKKSSTVNRQFTLYSHFFKKCLVWFYLERNPFQHLKRLREYAPTIKLLDEKTINFILIKIQDVWFKNAFVFLLLTGCRPDELRNLKTCDINLDDRTLNLFCLKNANGFRTLPFSDDYFSFFRDLKYIRSTNDYVFYTSKNLRVTSDSLTKKLKKLCKAHGLPPYSIYSLRHSYLTEIAKNNNLELVRKLAGHSKLITTQKYVHVDFFELKKAVNFCKSYSAINK